MAEVRPAGTGFNPLPICRLVLCAALLMAACTRGSESRLRARLSRASGVFRLPAGVVELTAPLELPSGIAVIGSPKGTVLRASANFHGSAMLLCKGCSQVRLSNFVIDGNRAVLEQRKGLPPYDVPFARFYANNGVLAEDASSLEISHVTFHEMAGFAVLVTRGRNVHVDGVRVENSGSRDARGRNNTTGGILLEDGTTGFRIENCVLRNVRGNGIWTHSSYGSPRNTRGVIVNNSFDTLARDAIQLGHCLDVEVARNKGLHIGWPQADVDIEEYATPVGIDTAGNVEHCNYRQNRFDEVNGKCIDLDGFHDGEVRDNVCTNHGSSADYPFGNFGIVMNNANPQMRSERIRLIHNTVDGVVFSGLLVIGTGHEIRENRFLNLNLAHCNEDKARCSYLAATDPELLRSGIYLARGAERPDPARANTIEGNEISGYRIRRHCIVSAPGVSFAANHISSNRCSDTR
jgi:Right handed beta helix region